jgi:endonuclease YncB( thermonuclease family)
VGHPWQCGDDATRALQTLVDQGEISCSEVDRDRYGRTIATCTVKGQDVGSAMVRSGWALDYDRYSHGRYAAEQRDAIQAQSGLWSGSFVPPWGVAGAGMRCGRTGWALANPIACQRRGKGPDQSGRI